MTPTIIFSSSGHGYQKYDTRDSREREKAIRQNLCGIYSEMAVRATVPVRDLATETEDSTPDPDRGFPFLKNGLWTVRQNGAELVVATA